MSDLAQLYDDLAETYAAGRHLFNTAPILADFADDLPVGGRILDVGCGAGEPVARYFVDRGDTVTGIDVSERMLTLARRQVPEATFQRMDMRNLVFPSVRLAWRGRDSGRQLFLAVPYTKFHFQDVRFDELAMPCS